MIYTFFMEIKDKKVLLIGLGILGGGLSMAKYLISQGAKLTITDLRDERVLKKMIDKLPKEINYVLGKNPESELKKAELIILNPAVSAYSPLVKKIQKMGKEYYSDYTFFLKNLRTKTLGLKSPLIIGVTGTRGKTTISSWTHHFIEESVLGGNIPEAGLLKIIDKNPKWFILELSSFQLEHLTKKHLSPKIAIFSNLYVDHLNRYKNMNQYFTVKGKIYLNQGPDDFLIISNDEPIAKKIESKKPKGKMLYVSLKKLPAKKNGLFFVSDNLYHQTKGETKKIGQIKNFAPHEKTNFMLAALAANLAGVNWKEIFKKAKTLKNPIFRQEIIFNKGGVKIINDSAGTNPEATMAAIEKYKNNNLYLITGGTDKKLDSKDLGKKIAKNINPGQVYLLSGSATNKLIDNFSTAYLKKSNLREFENLEQIIKEVSKEIHRGVILFSPGAASFEKFKKEFDRGKQFNRLVKKYFG